ncbi:MAG TPA: response regulator [Pyrinomonadaceae bacterium]|jgi:two-component system cell cycle response regulator DivK|nr:response regulator [Pyrinomonadaceae bacterium]
MAFRVEAYPTILVVDDSEDTRLVLRRALETRYYRVLEAANGEEAVEIARRESPDLILMDLNMPLMDGLEAAKRIRECKELCRSAPILAITAFDTYGMEEAALDAGCNAYLRKPFDSDEPERSVRGLLPGWC